MANKRTSSGQPNAAKASRRRSAPATEQVDANDQPEATELARAFGVDTNAVKGVRMKDQLFSLVDVTMLVAGKDPARIVIMQRSRFVSCEDATLRLMKKSLT